MLVVLSSREETSPWAMISADASTRTPEDVVNDLANQGSAPRLPGVTVVLEMLQNRTRLLKYFLRTSYICSIELFDFLKITCLCFCVLFQVHIVWNCLVSF